MPRTFRALIRLTIRSRDLPASIPRETWHGRHSSSIFLHRDDYMDGD